MADNLESVLKNGKSDILALSALFNNERGEILYERDESGKIQQDEMGYAKIDFNAAYESNKSHFEGDLKYKGKKEASIAFLKKSYESIIGYANKLQISKKLNNDMYNGNNENTDEDTTVIISDLRSNRILTPLDYLNSELKMYSDLFKKYSNAGNGRGLGNNVPLLAKRLLLDSKSKKLDDLFKTLNEYNAEKLDNYIADSFVRIDQNQTKMAKEDPFYSPEYTSKKMKEIFITSLEHMGDDYMKKIAAKFEDIK